MGLKGALLRIIRRQITSDRLRAFNVVFNKQSILVSEAEENMSCWSRALHDHTLLHAHLVVTVTSVTNLSPFLRIMWARLTRNVQVLNEEFSGLGSVQADRIHSFWIVKKNCPKYVKYSSRNRQTMGKQSRHTVCPLVHLVTDTHGFVVTQQAVTHSKLRHLSLTASMKGFCLARLALL